MSVFDPLNIQAYRDGQLPPDQARALEEMLDASMKERIQGENRLEELIVNRIRTEASSCPEPLWQDLQNRIRERSGAPRFSRRFLPYLSVAASILLISGLFVWLFDTEQAGAVEIPVNFTGDIAEFKQAVSITGDLETIQQRLQEEGYDVQIGDIALCNRTHPHYVELIGMDPVIIDGKAYPCVRLSFACCGSPVATYLLKKADLKDTVTFKANLSKINQAVHERDDYRIVTISPHPTEAVESLFKSE